MNTILIVLCSLALAAALPTSRSTVNLNIHPFCRQLCLSEQHEHSASDRSASCIDICTRDLRKKQQYLAEYDRERALRFCAYLKCDVLFYSGQNICVTLMCTNAAQDTNAKKGN